MHLAEAEGGDGAREGDAHGHGDDQRERVQLGRRGVHRCLLRRHATLAARIVTKHDQGAIGQQRTRGHAAGANGHRAQMRVRRWPEDATRRPPRDGRGPGDAWAAELPHRIVAKGQHHAGSEPQHEMELTGMHLGDGLAWPRKVYPLVRTSA